MVACSVFRGLDDFVAWIGDDAAGIGVDAFEKVIVTFGIGKQHFLKLL